MFNIRNIHPALSQLTREKLVLVSSNCPSVTHNAFSTNGSGTEKSERVSSILKQMILMWKNFALVFGPKVHLTPKVEY